MKIFNDFKLRDNTRKLSKWDFIIMGVMVFLYGILSFVRLGDTRVPNTYYTFNKTNDEVVISLVSKTRISKMRYYTGNNLGEIEIMSSADGENYKDVKTIRIDSVFSWQDVDLDVTAKYIKFIANSDESTLGDVVFYGNHDNIIPVEGDNNNPLTDEVDLVPENITYMNSTYFDEIYYARTAYEYLHGIPCYEWTHPPLGKLLIAIPIAILGFSPFSYRLMANIFGILLIPIMYILAKRFFKDRKWAILGGLIMMFDNFHFAHTRIALVDGFQVTFILLSVLFMKEYMDLGKDSDFKKQALYLILSGFFIGCAIDTKWNALYAGLGLAIVFFVHLFREYNVNVIKFCKEKITLNKIVNALGILIFVPFILYYLSFILINKDVASIMRMIYYFIAGCFIMIKFFMFIYNDKYLSKLLFTCCLSFIVLPTVIYILSYVLFPNVTLYDGTIKGVIDMNTSMYNYHAYLDATHPFSSAWYRWPIMAKPVWFYTGGIINGYYLTISDIGNPAIWWCGVIAFVYLVIDIIKKREKNNIFIMIFILATFVPYIFVGRLMFMYHYFITLPFVMLAIVAFIKWITEKINSNKVYYGYIVLIIITFAIFYPVVSGMPVKLDYVESLKWLREWFF